MAANYGAKLISANDSANFTYRGCFATAEEACAISYEATQKVHSALTWLAARQGVTAGIQNKRTYICWNPNGKPVVNLDNPLALEEDDEPRSYTEEGYRDRLYQNSQWPSEPFGHTMRLWSSAWMPLPPGGYPSSTTKRLRGRRIFMTG